MSSRGEGGTADVGGMMMSRLRDRDTHTGRNFDPKSVINNLQKMVNNS